ncbi:tyrosine-type recombinase/integrase [Abyssogena phaseoliformis symbiont]|uniref:tyrosine-type recombinase/integrase n=1 Tax=Abyssogena phaseoliformis symbiont TaxID=596095 RepID=UPI001915BF25
MLTLLYSCGLRPSEVLKLKIKDINFSTNKLTISNPRYFRTLSCPLKLLAI